MMGGFDGMMGGWMWMLFFLLFWGGLLALIVWAVVQVLSRRDGERPERRGESAEEILRARFARGEIDAEEYERSLEVLRNERGSVRNDA